MTELAVRKSTDLIDFAEEASRTHAVAKALATTSFVPSTMKGKPDDITAAILFGKEINLDPMTALQTINIIQGRPTLTANAMRGLAMAHGVKFKIHEQTETRVVMSAIAPGQDDWTTVTWTIDQAKRLNLTSKDNWKNQPGAMLIARATSQLCRLVAANVLIGLPYSSEEMADVQPTEGPSTNDNPEPEKKTRKISRAAVRATVGDEPPLEREAGVLRTFHENAAPELAPAEQKAIAADSYSTADPEKRTAPEEPVERPDGIQLNTRTAIMASFREAGIGERSTRLAYVSDVIGREVHSVNQLTETEGKRVVARLKADREGWPEAAEVPS